MNYATILAMMAALLTIGCTPEHAASYYAPAIDTNDQPSREITGVLEELEFSGSILVGKKEEIILRQAVNAWPTEDVQPVNSDTRFPIASMTKSFTASLVLQLVDEGKLDLDQSLEELLPDFETPYARDVPLRHLLQNRSGIPHYVDIPGWFDNEVKRSFTDESFMDTLEALELRFRPGSDYLYSNVNYYLLARIIDRHAGTGYEDYLRSQILDPLGLDRTGQIYQDEIDLAANYFRSEDGGYEIIPITNPVLFRGTASMYSTVDDLSAWGQAVLNGDLLSETGRKEAFNPEAPMAWTVTQMTIGSGEPTEVIFYNGRLIGYLSLVLLLPEQDGVIVVLNNNTVGYENLLTIASTLAEEYFSEPT
ncbi:serine hydrolase domain-containing protein [Hyphomonas sp. UBA3601]|uniref:serine hydrolase domain-containing protein n=1 Tax=Hyphomonas sp. UBA3601 TaxID=1946626 RepID=UPI0025BF4221|nr:serine hydrolase domain-containing protein [Hyphomonas sp. UBA3601]